MHKDQAEGAGKQVKGTIKDAAGAVTGDERLQAEGKMDKAEGKVQQKVGDAKEAVRDALKH
ncbi:MAG: CsbD family protein [Verrucomicrobiaceae bacterium]|nr:MAG: CsbD family protein [Verrucomicrobiaceae bacterium]